MYLVSLFLGVFIWAGLVYKFLHCEREEAGRFLGVFIFRCFHLGWFGLFSFGGVLVFGFWDILGCLHC